MNEGGYTEKELVSNRAAVLLWGGTEAERAAWAEEAANHFAEEGPLSWVRTLAELGVALRRGKGVAFLPDLVAMGNDVQARLVRCFRGDEDRPKFVLALSTSPGTAAAKSLLRDDLEYALRRARIDLEAPGLREEIRRRREEEARAQAKEALRAKKRKLAKKKPVKKAKKR